MKIKNAFALTLALFCFATGCSQTPPPDLPGLPPGHSANQFYKYASRMFSSNKVCKDFNGMTSFPVGEVNEQKGYTKLEILAPGAFRFREEVTGKRYIGVSFLKMEWFLIVPQVCVWEEKDPQGKAN